MALTSPSRRTRGLAAAACAAVALPVLVASPAAAQTTTSTSTSGATSASAIRLTINLPSALPISPIQLDIDPVAGTVRSVSGSGPEAQAVAAIISGSVGENAQSFGLAEAKLPSPTEATGSPLAAVSEGIAGSPLADFLAVDLASSKASVTTAPSSASDAGTRIAVGLPTALAEQLPQVLDPLLSGLDEIIAALGPLDEGTAALCEGLTPVTGPLADGVAGVPVLGPVLDDVVAGTLSPEQEGLICTIRANLQELKDAVGASLLELGGVGGLFSTGLIETSQSLVTEGTKVTARSTAQVAGLSVLGQNPFGQARVLSTTSTAVVDKGVADATVDAAAVEAFAEPLLTLETDLDTITGDLTDIPLDGLTEVLDQVQALLDALAGIGIEGGRLGDPAAALGSCPDALTATLSGTFEQPGVCAAAAARGYGLAVTLPAELAEPLGITGPLIQLAFSPSAAVARSATQTTTTPTAVQGTLPRTGPEALLAAAGLALLAGAALVRRRRTAAEL